MKNELEITFEFVGGPNDGEVVRGRLGESSDAERHYLFSNHGRVGQRFAVPSDYAIETLASGGLEDETHHHFQRHHYVVTDRFEDEGAVWVRVTYVPEPGGKKPSRAREEDDDEGSSMPRRREGHLLIASPKMDDDWFAQTVVLVLHEDEEETLGVILNVPTPETVDELWEEVSEIPCESKQPVHVGGPIDGPVMALHMDETSADAPVVSGVFLALEKENLDWIVHQEAPFRLFVDTTSWEPGQLDEEIAQGDWLVLPASKRLLFEAPEDQWRAALMAFGRSFYRSLGITPVTGDPNRN